MQLTTSKSKLYYKQRSSKLKTFTASDLFDAILLMSDGSVLLGQGLGTCGLTKGEICFNVSMTGYQEILTDPSYLGQIITFTFPHIGNVGCNLEDYESSKVFCSGLIVRESITKPSNHRSKCCLSSWLKDQNVVGISGLDTRFLTRKMRKEAPQNALIYHCQKNETISIDTLIKELKKHPTLVGQELASQASADQVYQWQEGLYQPHQKAYKIYSSGKYHVIVIDYGIKRNILRHLVNNHFNVTVVPATASFEDIIKHNPDGIVLSNGPGDPFATSVYAQQVIRQILEHNIPLFGICLGSQLLALICGLNTLKLHCGHIGSNHPVKNLKNHSVEITSQNHCFCVSKESIPDHVEITHESLFDGTVEGVRHKTKYAFAVQYHPENSPGPHDSSYLFKEFYNMIEQSKIEQFKMKRSQKLLESGAVKNA